jgi:HEAT repeat protein
MRRVLAISIVILASGCGGGEPTMAGSRWAEALRDPDPKVRKKAAFTLGNIGPSDPAVLPALLGAMKDSDPQVRSEVILALVKYGPQAQQAVPQLTEMRDRDPDAKCRNYASKALEKLKENGQNP